MTLAHLVYANLLLFRQIRHSKALKHLKKLLLALIKKSEFKLKHFQWRIGRYSQNNKQTKYNWNEITLISERTERCKSS